MRKVTFGVANSLDNYIAREDQSVDWILPSEEAAKAMKEFWDKIDAVVLGRKTYEPVVRSGKAWPSYPGVKTYVFSRTIGESLDTGVQIISEDAAEFVRKLKSQEGKGIFVMGGGELAKSLFGAKVIDEIRLSIHPVLLGSGTPLFLPMERQIDLELLDCKSLQNGCVHVTYRVRH